MGDSALPTQSSAMEAAINRISTRMAAGLFEELVTDLEEILETPADALRVARELIERGWC